MSNFQEYPKLMKHPQHAAPVMKQLEGKGVGLFTPDTICVSPERFPDVTVATIDQERQYAARGYRPNNMSDPQMYEQAILESKPVHGYQFQEYPKWKYHAIEIPVIVKDQNEEKALGEGWSDRPVIATEEDLYEEEETPAFNGSDHPHEVLSNEKESTPAKTVKAKTVKAKTVEKIDKRSKAYRDAHA